MIEQGFPEIQGDIWVGIMAPKNNPEKIVTEINREITEFLGQPAARQRLAEVGFDVVNNLLYGTIITNYFAGQSKPLEEQAQDILDIVFNGILTDTERASRASSMAQQETQAEMRAQTQTETQTETMA